MAAIVYEVDVNFRVQLLVKQRVFGELYRYTLYYNIVSELLCLICSIFREHLNTKQNAQYNCNIEADSVQSPWSSEEFGDTKGVIRIRKSKKNMYRQHNGQMKKYKQQ